MDLWWMGRFEYVSTHSLKIIPKVKLIRCNDIPKFQKWRNTTSIFRSRKIFHRTNIEATYMSFLLKINQRLLEDLFNSETQGPWSILVEASDSLELEMLQCNVSVSGVCLFFIEALTSFLIVWWCAQQSYWSTSANHQLVAPHFQLVPPHFLPVCLPLLHWAVTHSSSQQLRPHTIHNEHITILTNMIDKKECTVMYIFFCIFKSRIRIVVGIRFHLFVIALQDHFSLESINPWPQRAICLLCCFCHLNFLSR